MVPKLPLRAVAAPKQKKTDLEKDGSDIWCLISDVSIIEAANIWEW